MAANADWYFEHAQETANPNPVKETFAVMATAAYLKEIRDLLQAKAEKENTCPHGGTGFCMSCVTPLLEFHLGDLSRSISNEAWQALRNKG